MLASSGCRPGCSPHGPVHARLPRRRPRRRGNARGRRCRGGKPACARGWSGCWWRTRRARTAPRRWSGAASRQRRPSSSCPLCGAPHPPSPRAPAQTKPKPKPEPEPTPRACTPLPRWDHQHTLIQLEGLKAVHADNEEAPQLAGSGAWPHDPIQWPPSDLPRACLRAQGAPTPLEPERPRGCWLRRRPRARRAVRLETISIRSRYDLETISRLCGLTPRHCRSRPPGALRDAAAAPRAARPHGLRAHRAVQPPGIAGTEGVDGRP